MAPINTLKGLYQPRSGGLSPLPEVRHQEGPGPGQQGERRRGGGRDRRRTQLPAAMSWAR